MFGVIKVGLLWFWYLILELSRCAKPGGEISRNEIENLCFELFLIVDSIGAGMALQISSGILHF